MTIRTMLAALLLASCAQVAVEGAPDCPGAPPGSSSASSGAGGSGASSSSSVASSSSVSGGTGGEGGALDACQSCPAPRGLCLAVGCSYEPVECWETVRIVGQTCASGVGRCDEIGNCVAPGGVCKPAVAWSMACHGFDDAAACDDGNPCTNDSCMGSYCDHQGVKDGKPCGDGWACKSGACCQY